MKVSMSSDVRGELNSYSSSEGREVDKESWRTRGRNRYAPGTGERDRRAARVLRSEASAGTKSKRYGTLSPVLVLVPLSSSKRI
eukprot:CAMPEP_0182456588 /NCGR_PEP_ID=MMETSP1319-20130603/2384_1 /TAXON_ID=172717 /ORGANISM="Bolidomonas pacifica, Strain RCC208" /LENGTH=83 /DNA_ID=CAMNT_0024654867 /DNA_START=115 /DNA_END=366 /DNA_ORIENTATION=-